MGPCHRAVVHVSPAWGHRADGVVLARLDSGEYPFEELAARRWGTDRFEVCCIPMFTSGISLGDVLRCVEVDGIPSPIVVSVIARSEYVGRRVYFKCSAEVRSQVERQIARPKVVIEASGPNLLGVALDESVAESLDADFGKWQTQGILDWEVG